jgi:hypothetical protein
MKPAGFLLSLVSQFWLGTFHRAKGFVVGKILVFNPWMGTTDIFQDEAQVANLSLTRGFSRFFAQGFVTTNT